MAEHELARLVGCAAALRSSKQPVGEPFAVYHFKEPRVPIMNPIWNHAAAAGGRIVLELGDESTNVWIKEAVH